MNTNNIKLKIRDLYKSFGRKKVLQGIDLDIAQGESLVIMGGSGSGKSVLIKAIVGIITPNSGIIEYDGIDLTKVSRSQHQEILSKFGFLFQGGALFDSFPVWQNVAFALLQNKIITPAKAKELAIRKLAAVGLEENVADLFPAELSGGMQKRAALARAIAQDPEIVFFDEPTTGLDPIMAGIINELIVTTTKDLGATAITITHDMHSAKAIADSVAMIYEGKIIWKDSTKNLDNSGNPYVDQFINGKTKGPIKILLQDH